MFLAAVASNSSNVVTAGIGGVALEVCWNIAGYGLRLVRDGVLL